MSLEKHVPEDKFVPRDQRARSDALTKALPAISILMFATQCGLEKAPEAFDKYATAIADKAHATLKSTFPNNESIQASDPDGMARFEAECAVREATVICSNTFGTDKRAEEIGCRQFNIDETVRNAPENESVKALIERAKTAMQRAGIDPDNIEIRCDNDGKLKIKEIHDTGKAIEYFEETQRLQRIDQKLKDSPAPQLKSAPQKLQKPIDPNRAAMRQFHPKNTHRRRV